MAKRGEVKKKSEARQLTALRLKREVIDLLEEMAEKLTQKYAPLEFSKATVVEILALEAAKFSIKYLIIPSLKQETKSISKSKRQIPKMAKLKKHLTKKNKPKITLCHTIFNIKNYIELEIEMLHLRNSYSKRIRFKEFLKSFNYLKSVGSMLSKF